MPNFIKEVKNNCVCPSCLGALKVSNYDLFTCGICGTKYSMIDTIPDFLNKHLKSEKKIHELSLLYDKASVKYKGGPKSCGDTTHSSFRHRLNIFKQWIDFSNVKNQKILDLGCGTGLMTEMLAGQNEVWGVDISIGLLRAARKKGIRTILSSAFSLPFKNDEFDMVICMGILPYYQNPDHIIAQISRVTRPNGKILISSPAPSLLIRSVRYLKNFTWKKSQLRRLYSPLDIKMYMKDQEIRVLDTCFGFNDQIVSCKNKTPPFRFQLLARVSAAIGILPEK